MLETKAKKKTQKAEAGKHFTCLDVPFRPDSIFLSVCVNPFSVSTTIFKMTMTLSDVPKMKLQTFTLQGKMYKF
jgi:hypothetical protein